MGRYYKVCARMNDRFTSSWAVGFCCLWYDVGFRTWPCPETGLLAFADLDHAKTYATRLENWLKAFRPLGSADDGVIILSGNGEPGPELPPKMPPDLPITADKAKALWKPGLPGDLGNDWPEGTVSLAWFEPEEVVDG